MKIANWMCRLFILAALPVLAGSPLLITNESEQVVPLRWHQNNLPYKWHLNEDGYSSVEFQTLEKQLKQAFQAWQSLPDSHVEFIYSGKTMEAGGGIGSKLSPNIDGINNISFVNSDIEFSKSVLAVCSTAFFYNDITVTEQNNDLDGDGIADLPSGVYPAGTIFDADIFFDGSKTFSPELIHNIALHEIGHCLGLDHSSIEQTIMYPITDPDLERGSYLKTDDIATLASYMGKEDAKSRYGEITGSVIDGVTGKSVRGAHVYAVDTETFEKVVGTYSYESGKYRLYLPIGQYFLQIEPLDASHVGLEAENLTDLINVPSTTFFDREFYDADESSYEEGTEEPKLFKVNADAKIENIDFYINQKDNSNFKFPLKKGLNYFGYPQKIPFGLNSYDLLQQLSNYIDVNRIERFNPETGGFEFTFMLDGKPQGIVFDIQEGEGYLVTSETDGELIFPGVTYCHEFTLRKGLNLVNVTCPPASFDSYQFLESLGSNQQVESIRYYDSLNKKFLETRYSNESIEGDKFLITHGSAIEIRMLVNNGNFKLSKKEITPPIINYVSPGIALPMDYVLISGQGFIADREENIVSLGGIRLSVQSASHNKLLVQVPKDFVPGNYKLSVTNNELKSNEVLLKITPTVMDEESSEVEQLLSGMSVNGLIQSLGEQDIYTFVALAGSRINVQLTSVASEPKLGLELLNPKGGLIAKNIASNPNSTVSLQNFNIKETGIYTIVISAQSVGAYNLSIDISAPQEAARTSVLLGDLQTAVKGTELQQPILLLVTDRRGQPVSNADVVISQLPNQAKIASKSIIKKNNSGQTFNAINDSGSVSTEVHVTTIKTDSYGLVAAKVAAPDLTQDTELLVRVPSIPDIKPITLKVKVIDTPIARVVIERTEQDCGDKCPVGAELPEPWRVTFLDADGNGVEGVAMEWHVITGDGRLGEQSGETTKETIQMTTDINGTVEVFHKLGEKLFLNTDPTDLSQPLIPLPQVVMMSVPGQSAPVIFTAHVKAGEVVNLTPSRISDFQVTLYTLSYNKIGLQASDEYGNPVENAEVKVLSPRIDSGIEILPGRIHGAPITNYQTNERGVWLGSIHVGGVIPTIDEFGNSDTEGLAETYEVVLAVNDSEIVFSLDVDMGPVLLASESIKNGLVGQPLNEAFTFKPHAFMRDLSKHTFPTVPFKANWSDVYKLHNDQTIEGYGWQGPVNMTVYNDITNIKDFSKLMQTVQKGENINFSLLNQDDLGTELRPESQRLTCVESKEPIFCDGELQGRSYRERVGKVKVDNIGDFYNRRPVIIKAVIPSYTHGIFVGTSKTQHNWGVLWNVAKETQIKNLTGFALAYPEPISMSFSVEDLFLGNNSDTSIYPGMRTISGIDLDTLKISLPDGSVVDGKNIQERFKLNSAPNFAQLWLDYHKISEIDEHILESSPQHLQLIYEPKASELTDGENTFSLVISDQAGNSSTEVKCTFVYPSSIKCQD